MSDLVVQTTGGKLRGKLEDGVAKWLGIPFAGLDRFAAPGPAPAWDGVRDAHNFMPQCPQMFGTNGKRARSSGDYGEDCLGLNVFVPNREASGEERTAGRPVYVFIHGGAFIAGSSNPYNGSWLADLGDIVVVTINYRVGVLGFVNFGEALGLPDIPTNVGLRDQIAALEWIRDNIAEFGGDPSRVTIGGQSAGSMSVSLLMLSPKARGLFHGAVLQSGAVSLIHDRESSVEVARRYAEVLDLDQSSLEKLRTMDVRQLFDAQGKVQATIKQGIPAAPWYDGDVLPASLSEARKHGVPDIPIIAGSTSEESRLFELMGKGILPLEREENRSRIAESLGEARAEEIVSVYPDTKQGNRALASDHTFLMPTRNFAERHSASNPTWVYRFDFASPFVGAAHAMDLTVTWPFKSWLLSIGRGGRLKGKRKALGERFNSHFANFTRHGKPLDDWPRYTSESRQVKIFNLEDSLEEDADGARRAAWAGDDVAARRIAAPAQ